MKIAVAGGTGTVGHHVVDIARERGHEALVLSRGTGIDLVSGDGLGRALAGVDVVVDAASVATQSAKVSERFFGAVTANLLAAEQTAGVAHHIALSIVGSDKAPYGYYAGKAVQERLVREGSIPWTILRATQFHEFAQQLYGRVDIGPIHLVPTMVSQPVAAHEVGLRLVELAETGPAGLATDLAGPETLRMAHMVRAYANATGGTGPILQIPLPGGFGKAMRDGSTEAGPDADRGTQTFAEWIAGIARTPR